MNKQHMPLLLLLTFFAHSFTEALDCASTSEIVSSDTHTITIICTPHAKEELFHNSLSFSVDNPDYEIIKWEAPTPTQKYSTFYKDTRAVHVSTTPIHITVHQKAPSTTPATLHMHYMTNLTKEPTEYMAPIPADTLPTETLTPLPSPLEQRSMSPHKQSLKALVFQKIQNTIKTIFTTLKEWSITLSNSIRDTNSRTLQFLLVFLLGILMSLTPCIYPMIPVTIGILQANSAQSIIKNFLIALSYTCGVASTFAFLGFLAATGSAQFGQLAGSPVFIIIIVTILGYLGLSMFGWYDMYIPRFLQPRDTKIKQGSPLAAFLFGAISGTIASPCLSPGLAFVLTIVASLKSSILGLALLFAFGVGSSLPLLIIGTFSTSLNVLPKAGAWMIEVKKLFGFMLFGMCFYYLHMIIPTPVLLGIISSFLAVKGAWYFVQVKKHDSQKIKNYKNGMGFILIISAVTLVFQACKDWACAPITAHASAWHTDYALAQEAARAEHKNMLLDFTADWCSVCKLIEKKILNAPAVVQALTHVVPVTINSTHVDREPYATLKKQYAILGVPTLLLVDSETGDVIQRWGSELLELDVQEFIQQLS